jgi:predicted esterase
MSPTPRNYAGAFEATPIFIGCSDIDPHIPLDRVRESAAVLGASVDERIYPRMAHTIVADEIGAVDAMFAAKA